MITQQCFAGAMLIFLVLLNYKEIIMAKIVTLYKKLYVFH